MFKIDAPEYFIYLIGILIPLGIIWLGNLLKNRREKLLGTASVLQEITYRSSRKTDLFKVIFGIAVIIFLVLALVNPQWGRKKEKVEIESTEVILALDISESMLAEDVKPSRLERARLLASKLIDRLAGEKIGLVLFAGDAYVQVPTTTDYAALKLFIKSASPKLASIPGTDFATAIERSISAFPSEERRPGTIILITDGENHEPGDIEAAQKARDLGYSIHCIGIGSRSGSTIPISFGGRQTVKRDSSGAPVVSRLDQQTLLRIAQAGGGDAFLISEGQKVFTQIKTAIDNLEETESEQLSFAEYVSYYQYFLAAAIVFLILFYLLPFGKKIDDNNLFS